eukprot:COSAG05_NODE_19_length_34900_cov_72.237464_12_plen_52_part_00
MTEIRKSSFGQCNVLADRNACRSWDVGTVQGGNVQLQVVRRLIRHLRRQSL